MADGAALDPEKRAALNRAVLRALVRDHWGIEAPEPDVAGTGAAVVVDDRAFVLLEAGVGGIGAALVLAWRSGATSVDVVVHEGGAEFARQAAQFATPVSVWRLDGSTPVAVSADDSPHGAAPPDAPELVALLRDQGLDVVVEGDHLAGELRGLELARILRDEDGEPGLAVGVGRFDRELTAMVHGDLPPADALARVAEQVREIRRHDAPSHPLRELVPERWLRSVLLADPSKIGCADLAAAPAPRVRDRLRTRGIAAATGTRDGERVVVACTVGVHLDAVPQAADARAALDPGAPLLVVCPERDRLPAAERLVDDLVAPAELVTVGDEWRSFGVPA